jgi:hypothetical protein
MTTKKPKPANPVSQEASDLFAMLVKKWQAELNLNDWRIERSPRPAGKANLAEISKMYLPDRLATYRLGADFGDATPITEHTLDQLACHEVLHVFFKELIEFAGSGAAEDIASAEHRCINTLVKLLVPEN